MRLLLEAAGSEYKYVDVGNGDEVLSLLLLLFFPSFSSSFTFSPHLQIPAYHSTPYIVLAH